MQTNVWQLGGLSVFQLAKRVWGELARDDVFNRAAALAYYFLLALFPALLFLITIFGWLAEAGTQLRSDLMSYLALVMPASALTLVTRTLDEISMNAGGGKLSIGLLLALWAASNGMLAIMDSLNHAYAVEETRPWYKVRAISIGLTLAISVLVVGALVLVLFGAQIADSWNLGALFSLARWLFVGVAIILAFALTYYFGPAVRDQRWYWITPGSAVGLVLWLAVSLGFRGYLAYFNSYAATYGSLGALIILVLWFYLSVLSFLIGGEVNAEIEAQAARAGDPTAKAKGTRKPGEPAPVAPHLSTCVVRPAPGLRELWNSFQGLKAAVLRFIAVLKEREGRSV